MGKPAWLERTHRARGVFSPAKLETVSAEPEPETELDDGQQRATCPDCDRDVAINKDGSLRKHACSADPLEE